ncbi:holo-ACP synthase [Pseudarthrobacter oxydans]|uniref:holo-ACP synthase n=1 Tax=Pseudarthrobacter oxydans TaxID=1671 RepID=UPI0015716099|nr:holo-ACP synthase [Pseudarthrobacter oxydans]NSX35174.1 holo-ACP synthase [Pseudarthrobacter oxydans]
MITSPITTGVDLVDCGRIARMLEEDRTFLDLAFTEAEQEDCQADPARLGARWAAKEAAMKALGQGIGAIAPLDIGVRRDENGVPMMELSGSAKARADELGITDWSVALSHEGGFAVAFVVMLKGGDRVR